MLYHLLKPIVSLYFRIFFKKIYLTGTENIVKDRPLVFAVNHPTAFLDPIVVASLIKPTTHFMIRGDIFVSPFIIWLLQSIKTIPIFRRRDGFAALKNNQGTMDTVFEKIKNNQHILILAEGQTRHEKKMRPIQKGAARMVLGAYEKQGDQQLLVIPVGVNYTNSDAFRSIIMVDFAEAIEASDYYEAYNQNPRIGIKQMTDAISARMYDRIIHVENDEDAAFTEILLAICRHDFSIPFWPVVDYRNKSLLLAEKNIAETINQMEPAAKVVLRDKALAYQSHLGQLGIRDIGLAKSTAYNLPASLLLLITFPLFVLGCLLNISPILLGRWVANKTVKTIEFHSSVRFGVGVIAYLVYYLVILLLLLVNFGWTGILLLLGIVALGVFSLWYRDHFLVWSAARKVMSLANDTIQDLLVDRKALMKF